MCCSSTSCHSQPFIIIGKFEFYPSDTDRAWNAFVQTVSWLVVLAPRLAIYGVFHDELWPYTDSHILVAMPKPFKRSSSDEGADDFGLLPQQPANETLGTRQAKHFCMCWAIVSLITGGMFTMKCRHHSRRVGGKDRTCVGKSRTFCEKFHIDQAFFAKWTFSLKCYRYISNTFGKSDINFAEVSHASSKNITGMSCCGGRPRCMQ